MWCTTSRVGRTTTGEAFNRSLFVHFGFDSFIAAQVARANRNMAWTILLGTLCLALAQQCFEPTLRMPPG